MNNIFLLMLIGVFLLKPSIVTSFKLDSTKDNINVSENLNETEFFKDDLTVTHVQV